MLATNREALVRIGVQGQGSHPTRRGGYSVGYDDAPVMRPGMSGVSVNLRVGSPAFGWACDHGEPGVSAEGVTSQRHLALQVMACIGNRVKVVSGPAAGATGVVTGKHAFVLIDFAESVLRQLAPGDRLLVSAWGQGLELTSAPEIVARNLGPELLEPMALEFTRDARLHVPVRFVLPPEVMGAGIGMSSEWANCDVMLHQPEVVRDLGLEDLRLGDLVAMTAQDHRFGRSFRPGWTSIGVVVHALGPTPGHGVGVVTILTGPERCLDLEVGEAPNLTKLLGLPL